MTRPFYDGRISLGNILTIIGMVLTGFWWLANSDKKDALQDAQIEANKSALKELIAAEQQARKEADQELRIRVDSDRAEMRAQFDKLEARIGNMDVKLNSKVDELLKQRGGQ